MMRRAWILLGLWALGGCAGPIEPAPAPQAILHSAVRTVAGVGVAGTEVAFHVFLDRDTCSGPAFREGTIVTRADGEFELSIIGQAGVSKQFVCLELDIRPPALAGLVAAQRHLGILLRTSPPVETSFPIVLEGAP